LESVTTIGIEAGTTRTHAAGPRYSDVKNSQIEYTPRSGYVQQFWKGFEILIALQKRIRLFWDMIKDVTPHTSDPTGAQRIFPLPFTEYSVEFSFANSHVTSVTVTTVCILLLSVFYDTPYLPFPEPEKVKKQ
jgi:hypothetical protein